MGTNSLSSGSALNANTKLTVRKRNAIFFWEIIACNPSIFRMDHPDFNGCSFIENSICLKRFKVFLSF